jgi:hypothetical protein
MRTTVCGPYLLVELLGDGVAYDAAMFTMPWPRTFRTHWVTDGLPVLRAGV